MARVLVVGAGLTGAAGAALLRGAPRGQVAVWDKARGAGGRMSTTRADRGSADLGAQFVTCEPELAGPRLSFYEELVTHGILKPLTAPVEGMVVREGSCNFVAPQGISSVVKYYLEQSGADVSYEQQVTDISLRDGRWEVSRKAGPPEHFDVAKKRRVEIQAFEAVHLISVSLNLWKLAKSWQRRGQLQSGTACLIYLCLPNMCLAACLNPLESPVRTHSERMCDKTGEINQTGHPEHVIPSKPREAGDG
ncbi:renalase isoform X6 [Haemorhous mexicanus]|uniref:renalase isoform X6 n=1 Tax=Haemorhous mexicanus TaxID=30427 RepID=UPI0028BD5E99|nr:renalase isoform X6 [Haemorhous mexicanus]